MAENEARYLTETVRTRRRSQLERMEGHGEGEGDGERRRGYRWIHGKDWGAWQKDDKGLV